MKNTARKIFFPVVASLALLPFSGAFANSSAEDPHVSINAGYDSDDGVYYGINLGNRVPVRPPAPKHCPECKKHKHHKCKHHAKPKFKKEKHKRPHEKMLKNPNHKGKKPVKRNPDHH